MRAGIVLNGRIERNSGTPALGYVQGSESDVADMAPTADCILPLSELLLQYLTWGQTSLMFWHCIWRAQCLYIAARMDSTH